MAAALPMEHAEFHVYGSSPWDIARLGTINHSIWHSPLFYDSDAWPVLSSLGHIFLLIHINIVNLVMVKCLSLGPFYLFKRVFV